MIAELLAGIAAKLGAAGVAAKAGVGLAVAAASISGAAAVGVLPDVASPSGTPVETVTTPGPAEADDAAEELGGGPDESGQIETENADDTFGKLISEDASDPESPGVDGSAVSTQARTLGAQHRPGHAAVPADAGQQGLSRAGDTPAAGHGPESVPAGPGTAEQYRPDAPVVTQPEEPATPEDTPVDGAPEETPAGAPDTVPASPPAATPGGNR